MPRYSTVDVTDYIEDALVELHALEEVAHMSAEDQERIEDAIAHLEDALNT